MTTLASTVLPLLLFLCQIVLLHSAQETKQGRDCSPFTCGGFKDVGFPFCSVHNPECGPCVMSCTGPGAKEAKVKFHEKGKWYHVDYFNYTARLIGIHDQDVLLHLKSNRCDLLNNFTEQVPPFLSIRVTETIELFKCKKSELHTISPPKFFDSFDNNTSCVDYDLYFYNDRNRTLPPLPDTLLSHCSVVHAPYSKQKFFDLYLKKDNHTSPWFSDFTLLWKTSSECLNCTQKGGRCQSSRNGFECGTSKTPNKWMRVGRKVGIGVGAGIGGILVTCIVFILYQRRKRNKLNSSSALLFRDISGDPSVKPYFKQGSIYFQTPEFTYKELEKATNHFDSNNELGDGGFGTVYHGKLRDGRVVAIKRLFEHNHKRVEQFMNEVIILSRLHHQNLVSLYGCTNRKCQELLLVYEYVPNGTVADHLHGNRATAGLLTWPIRMSIAIETADALKYLHASDIIHRDVKSSNILLDNGFHVKVADFGLSRLFPSNITHVSTAPQGTPGYVDPEYHQCYQLNDKSDVYSFGVVLIELISSKPAVDIGRPLHEINLANMALNKIHNRALHELVDPSLGFDSDYSTRNMITLVAELAFRCLQQEKEMRPHMIEVLEILRGIESAYKMQKADDMTISAESRIKNSEPFSPDSVTDKWVSKSSTPNTSG